MGEEEDVRREAEARVGATLKDKWRLDKLLGVGGMASVYAATHTNQKRVAVKILHRDLSINADVRARFLREGYLANTVGHPGVVTVDDDNVLEDGSAFLVMELLEGETLEARRAKQGGTLPAAEVLGYAEKLLDVLAAAHDKGVVHRDLKPENLFLTTSGELKVLDFGIARLQEMSASSGGTRIGAIMGTPTFMAPEQARARWDEVDGRTDLFAVGATMYTLLSGRYVHEAETVNEELGLAMTARAASLSTVAPSLPAPLVAFADRALAFEKAARWPDARTMRAAIEDVRGSLAEAPPTPARATPPPSPADEKPAAIETKRALSPARMAAIGGVAVAVVVVGILALRSGQDGGHPQAPAPAATMGNPVGVPQTPPATTASASVDVAPAEPAPPPTDTPDVPAHTVTAKVEEPAPRKDAAKPPPTSAAKAPPPATAAGKPPATPADNLFDKRH